MLKTAVCDLETGVNWPLKENGQHDLNQKLYCDEITEMTWTIRREELICTGNNFVGPIQCVPVLFEPVQIPVEYVAVGRGKETAIL